MDENEQGAAPTEEVTQNTTETPEPTTTAEAAEQAKAAKAPKPPKDEANGVVKPARGVTLDVWNIATELSNGFNRPAKRGEVLKAAGEKNINPATITTQYGLWARYHGLDLKAMQAADRAAAKTAKEAEAAAKKQAKAEADAAAKAAAEAAAAAEPAPATEAPAAE